MSAMWPAEESNPISTRAAVLRSYGDVLRQRWRTLRTDSTVTSRWQYIALAAILLLATLLRFVGRNWDENQYLHPDERFITMVATGVRWPSGIGQYFDSATSPLNPYNNDYGSFIYGDFPLFIGKLVGDLTGNSAYGNYHIAMRGVSAACDVITVLLVFLVGRRLFGATTGLIAAFLLACTVFHIQLSHFGTFDTFAAMLCLATFHFALRANQQGRWFDYALAGVAAGLATASKFSALPILLVVALPLVEQIRLRGFDAIFKKPGGVRLAPFIGVPLALVAALWTFRIGQPYAFIGPSPFSFRLDPRWTADLDYWRDVQSGIGDAPPAVQWADRPFTFILEFLVQWGMGPALGITALIALALAGIRIATSFRLPPTWLMVLVGWPAFHLVYFSLAFTKANRYTLPAYPFLVLLAAALLLELWRRGRDASKTWQKWQLAPLIVVGVLTFLYAISFTSIYTRTQTRIAASEWIYQNVPAGVISANEHWDDPIPVNLPGFPPASDYPGLQLALYDLDTPEKLEMLLSQMQETDYIFLTSNRLYDSIPRIPERYPMTIEYYRALFAGELGFELVETFTNRPQLFGIELVDDSADESFTVYDHPKVLIFKKTDAFDISSVQQQLAPFLAQDISNVRSSLAGHSMLMLSDADAAIQQSGGTWSDIFDRDSLPNTHPALVWYLAIQLLAFAALPLCWRLLKRMPDAGVAISKTIGILGAGYVAWLLASLHVLDFGRLPVLIGLLSMALLSAIAIRRQWRDFISDLQERWTAVFFAEFLFLGAFALFVYLRSINPDLWHAARGGEKPMEFAYFNAVIRSTHFPPYDPWFSGGYLNYYYFGWALFASLVRLTGIIPAVSFNLAVATCFSLAVINSWAIVTAIVAAMRRELHISSRFSTYALGLLGPLFVVLIGNIDLARRIGRGEYGYPPVDSGGRLSLGHWGDIMRGVWRALTDHHPVPTDIYWAPTRVIEGAINEFPYFSFLFADLHPHMMSIAFALGVVVIAVGVLYSRLWPDPQLTRVEKSAPVFGLSPGWFASAWDSPRDLLSERVALSVLLAFTTGALYPLNTWDYPTYLLLVIAAYVLLEFLGGLLEHRLAGEQLPWRVSWASLRRVALWSGITVVGGRLLFLPYFQHYLSPSEGFDPWYDRTPPDQYMIVHGLLLFFVMSFVIGELLLGTRSEPVRRRALPAKAIPSDAMAFAQSISLPVEALQTGRFAVLVALAAAAGLTMFAFLADLVLPLIAAMLILVIALAWLRRHAPARLLLLGMCAAALAISAMVEMYTLRGDIGRMNTVFKFYLQVWTLLGLVAAVSVVVLALQHSRYFERGVRAVWGVVAIVLVAAGLVYPAVATPARLDDRFNVGLPQTLDGQAYMPFASFDDAPDGRPAVSYFLDGDYLAIQWMLDNIEGSPVILEAQTPEYRWGSRYSVNTGLPTVLGWNWHQIQQRPGYGDLVERRRSDVFRLYNDPGSFDSVRELLDKYGVRYIIVGEVERAYYEEIGLQKFADAVTAGDLTIVYDAEGVVIYEYLPSPPPDPAAGVG